MGVFDNFHVDSWMWCVCVSVYMCVCVCVCLVTQLCPTLCGPMNRSPPGASVHGIPQARILEWVAISFSNVCEYSYVYTFIYISVSSVQLLSCVWLFGTRWIATHQASLSITSSRSLLKLTSSNHDAIQPCHPLSSPSPPAFNLSQHQSLFQWVNSSHEVAKVLELQFQHQSFQWTPRTDLL